MAVNVDQAVAGLKKAEQYIKHGLTTLPEMAGEFLDLGTPNAKEGLEEYKALMMEYSQMDQDTKLYAQILEDVKHMITRSSIRHGEATTKLDELYEKAKKKLPSPNSSEEYRNFEKLLSSREGDGATEELDDDTDLVLETETQLLKCPYTGKLMVDPVKNTNCGHSYDKEGITLYIKQRGKRARCPVSGCANQSYITQRCLVPDMKLRKELDKRKD